MKQRQEMILAPRMLQSIEVLTLPAMDLEGWLSSQAELNEALLVEPPDLGGDTGDGHGSGWESGPGRGAAARSKATDDHYALLQAQPGPELSLSDEIEAQLASRDLGPELSSWIRFLVSCLDEGGLLSVSDEELAELSMESGLPYAGAAAGRSLLADAIAELQQFEPRGIGARSSVEALLLQLDPMDSDYGLLCSLLEDFLFELSRNQRPSVASKLGLELAELDRLLGVLERLDTRPTAGMAGEMAPALTPDLIALSEDGGETFGVELTRGALPRVSVDPVAEELLSGFERGSDARAYLAEKVEKARWVLEAVEMRGVTLLRVAQAALRHQAAFLRHGPTSLVPLAMKDVAAELELATSTVSRAVAGKAVQTAWGIVPLRSLFQTTAGEAAEGQAASSTEAVRGRVKALVGAENPSSPLSDEALVKALVAEGHNVARRTVAKYRGELGIPSSYRRKRHG